MLSAGSGANAGNPAANIFLAKNLLGYRDVVNNALHSDNPIAIRVEYESDT